MSDTSFPEREKGYEAKYAHDEEFRFRATARRDKLIAQWAADRLGLSGAARDRLVAQVLSVPWQKAHDAAVIAQVAATLEAADSSEIAQALARCALEAERQLQGELPSG